MYNLYQRNGNVWRVQTPVLTQQTFVVYDLQEDWPVTFDQELLPPATLSMDSSQEFSNLSATNIYHKNIVSPTGWIPGDLLEWLSTSPVKWAIPLWHQI